MKKSESQKTTSENKPAYKEKEAVAELSDKPRAPEEFLIVGIGASAGGIQALKEFFRNVPADSGIAYVVILHLSPDHDSQLASVLQTVARIPVAQVTERVRVEPNRVYVVPPNEHLEMLDGEIVVTPNVSVEERRAPVDIFFRTLAESHHARAVAVVLSGTGANGSMGVKRVKERGGAAFVQNPREAEFSEMPRHSIATDLIDQILNVGEIPARIIAYQKSLGTVAIPVEAEQRPADTQQALREIFTQLRLRTGHDFSNYKRPTVLRRIERRINVFDLPDLASYARFVRENPDEATALLKDLLISVTNFFRDREAFHHLEFEILPKIFHNKTSADQVRIWVCGCATGEEAYSLAMLCSERILGAADAPVVQIFATDIDEQAIGSAREGFYTLNDAADVSPERLRRFFTKENDGYRVRRELREMILFANHNVIKDPPFSRLDAVTCRNMLIYLNPTAQERVMETFHFALNPGGFLFLGNSESVDGAGDLYATVSKESHIFQSRQATARMGYPAPETSYRFAGGGFVSPHDALPTTAPLEAAGADDRRGQNQPLQRISFGNLHQQLLEQYAPPSIVVNEEYDIVHLTERAGRFLQMTGGEPTKNLLKLIRPELRLELRTALYQAVQRQSNVEIKDLKILMGDHDELLNIYARPVLRSSGDTARGFVLVIFEQRQANAKETSELVYTSHEPIAGQLEEELLRTKSQLRQTVEQFEVQAEELKASNEELQALNEELRSAAEELETSKEELQSLNEELVTVNQELKIKIEEITQTNNDFHNLINSSDIATIFLDRSFRVNGFTPAASRIFNLIPADYGRPLADITHRLETNGLLHDAETVLDTLQAIEREARTTDGRTYFMRVLPYRTQEDRINGVVATFFDISDRKQIEIAKFFLASIVESSEDAIITVNLDGIITSWNSAAQRLYGYPAAEAINKPAAMLALPEDLEKILANAERIKHSETVETHETVSIHKDGQPLELEIVLSPVKDAQGKIIGVSTIARDISERKQTMADLRASEENARASEESARLSEENARASEKDARSSEDKYRTLFNSIDEGFSLIELIFDDTGTVVDYWLREANPMYEQLTGMRDAVGKRGREVLPNVEPEWLEKFETVYRTGEPIRFEYPLADLGRVFTAHLARVGGEGSRLIATIFDDITERKLNEQRLLQQSATDSYRIRLNDALRPLSDAAAIQGTTAKLLREYFDVGWSFYVEFDDTKTSITVVTDSTRDGLPSMVGRHDFSDMPEFLRLWQAGQIVRVEDFHQPSLLSSRAKKKYLASGINSFLGAPVLKNGVLIAALVLADTESRPWSDIAIELTAESAERTWAIVERARAEKDLRESEGRLRALVENLPGGAVFIVDKNLRYLIAEGEALTAAGFAPADLIGRAIGEAMPPELAASYEPMYRKALAGEPFEHEHEAYDRTFISRGVPLADASGENYAVLAISYDITDRRRAEEAVRESEERLRLATEAGGLGAWEWNLRTDEVFWNEQHFILFGMEPRPNPLESKDFFDHVHPDERERVGELLQKSIRERTIFDADFRAVLDTGEQRWMSGYGRVIEESANGEPSRMSGLMFDITERKRAEEAVRESEIRYRAIVGQATAGIAELDLDGYHALANPGYSETLGYTEAELLEMNLRDVTHPDDYPFCIELFEDTIKTGTPHVNEKRIIRKDGEIVWITENLSRITDAGGNALRVAMIAIDITNRRRAEEALAESETRLRLLVESASDYAIFTTTREGLIDSWNAGAEKVFGWTEKEALGKSAAFIFTPEDRKKGEHEKELETALRDGRAPDERFHLRKDGSRFYVSGVMTLLKDAYGNVRGFAKIARDMTERLKAEKDLRDKEILKRLVGAQEDERKRIARDLHDHLGQQLTALRLKLEAARKLCAEEDEQLCDQIDDTQRIARSIDKDVDFLAWELRPAALDDLGLAAALEVYAKEWALHSNIETEFYASGLDGKRLAPEIETNLYRIAQEALNNVSKHARARNANLILEKRGSLVLMIIEDDGAGFDLEDKDTRSQGLGLIGMQERAALVGGKLQIESSRSDGTTVFVRIPIE